MLRKCILILAMTVYACASPVGAGAKDKTASAHSAASAVGANGGLNDSLLPVRAVAGPATSVPYGWVDFCRRYQGECATESLPAVDVILTPLSWQEIDRVNRWTNATIVPMSDFEHWGVEDQWDYPTDGKGDCEDYALLKRRLLIEAGMPRQALLMTVVRDENGEGHAVLTLKTTRGDYILDNKVNETRLWSATGYQFIKRQSQDDPNIWVTLRGNDVPSVAATR